MLRNISILIYADTAALQETAAKLARDPRLARTTVEVRHGGAGEAAQWLAEHASPDVMVVGDPTDEGTHDRLEHLAANVEAGCKVVVAGRKDSVAVFRELVAQGIADYLAGPVTPQDVIDCLGRLFTDDKAMPKSRLVAAMSASGGAGGSTVAAVLTAVLSERVGDTLLVDLDLNLGTSGLLLGIDVRDSVAEAMANTGLDVSMLERFIVRDKGIRVLSTPGSLRHSGPHADAVERIVDMARGMAKVVVVDLPKGWSVGHERIMAAADDVVIVATPELASLRNSRMIVDHMAGLRGDAAPVRVLINKAGLAKGHEYNVTELREALGKGPAAIIPWDPEHLRGAVTQGKPVTAAGGKAMAALRTFGATVLPAPRKTATSPQSSFPWPLKAMFARTA